MISGILLFGLLMGMRHTFEADHIAAMASLSARDVSLKYAVKQGLVWGVGHTLTLLLLGILAITLKVQLSDQFSMALELIVGVMLIFLGVGVFKEIVKRKIHFHIHEHEDGTVHLHVHSHQDKQLQSFKKHNHRHPDSFPFRALYVGIMHGLAGTAALVVLALNNVDSPIISFLYIILFAVSSFVGMGLLSFVIAIPLHYSVNSFRWLHVSLLNFTGVATILTGSFLIYQIGVNKGFLATLI